MATVALTVPEYNATVDAVSTATDASTTVSSITSSPHVTSVSIPQADAPTDTYEDALASPRSFTSVTTGLSETVESPHDVAGMLP